MNLIRQTFKDWSSLLHTLEPDPAETQKRIRYMERNVGLLVRAAVVALLLYYLFFSKWFERVSPAAEIALDIPPREMVLDALRRFFLLYLVMNAGFASLMIGMGQLPLAWVQRIVFVMAWVDPAFIAALVIVTGGFDSVLYWVFLGMIVRNAISTPDVARQIFLNLSLTGWYVLAGIADNVLEFWEGSLLDEKIVLSADEAGAESFVLRFILLLLMTVCCYGVQVLLDRQRRAEHEAQEHAIRQQQFEATGRLAAEIAHQIKNPLGIINNAAFTLQRTVKEGKTITQQIKIIREEVDRSDRIITELMGYARLSEGKIEKLSVAEVLDHAIEQAFPVAAKYDVVIERDYGAALPSLMMQRSHLSEIFMNLLVNARDAMNGSGTIKASISYGDDYSVVAAISDTGPGIPQDKLPKVFDPYFTTKEKGSGLGLAIVKHNAEIYGGTVRVDSKLGKGTQFTVQLPARTSMKIRK